MVALLVVVETVVANVFLTVQRDTEFLRIIRRGERAAVIFGIMKVVTVALAAVDLTSRYFVSVQIKVQNNRICVHTLLNFVL